MTDLSDGYTTAGVATFLDMYRVQPGIPFERVLEEVSVILGCVRELSEQEQVDPVSITALHYLSAMAKALLNDLEVGRNSVH
ncbi:DUF3077 domain-containing protein [Pseudomonas putida]|uniref:DUF3077 domain-containing protein n=1 Tax=Pseudomonas TaxID=286 RepID=UPI0007B6CCF1|nr:DUF3077 domain-containing protein [Pseudomonas putida]ANC02418.1 hypothetical protein AB688_09865 [Pseudomonas putida]OCT24987.1 hypothetical protein A6E24_13785 [Pseudomonas putida]OCT28974.1 hypothetical protein A6E23_04935 [Pseudomonas putida]OCT35991.1 hypothetical protein A6E20_19195 [Pseudomonas putida]OCT39323.1 hypothetical protein A6E19_07060 [Pseudomonas putida]